MLHTKSGMSDQKWEVLICYGYHQVQKILPLDLFILMVFPTHLDEIISLANHKFILNSIEKFTMGDPINLMGMMILIKQTGFGGL